MSYDIYLEIDTGAPDHMTLFHIDPTYNLSPMFKEALGDAGVRSLNGRIARDTIEILRKAVDDMEADPVRFKMHDAANGWGVYRDCLSIMRRLFQEASTHRNATWRVT